MRSIENHYQTLGILPNATNEEIEKAYKEKAKIYHPDKNKDNPLATEFFKRIEAAKECLINPEERLKHDYLFGIKKRAVPRSGRKQVDLQTLLVLVFIAGIVGAVLGYFSKRPKLA